MENVSRSRDQRESARNSAAPGTEFSKKPFTWAEIAGISGPAMFILGVDLLENPNHMHVKTFI